MQLNFGVIRPQADTAYPVEDYIVVAPSWTFVDGDTPGDGALWLEHPRQMAGWIDFIDRSSGAERRIMVVARSFVEASIADIGRESRSTAFAPMLVLADGTPAQLRAAIDEAVLGGALAFVLPDAKQDGLIPPAV